MWKSLNESVITSKHTSSKIDIQTDNHLDIFRQEYIPLETLLWTIIDVVVIFYVI